MHIVRIHLHADVHIHTIAHDDSSASGHETCIHARIHIRADVCIHTLAHDDRSAAVLLYAFG